MDPQAAAWAAAGGQVAPFGPGVDDVGLDAEMVGDLGDAELLVALGCVVDVVVLVGEPVARSRQACSTSGGKGMHQRPAGPRRAVR